MKGKLFLLILATFGFWQSCRNVEPDTLTTQQPLGNYDGHFPQSWMKLSYDAVKARGWFALDASRFYAYNAITLYECMHRAVPNSRSLAGQLQGLEELPQPDPSKVYDWGVVACHAMPQMMEELMQDMPNNVRERIGDLAREQEREMRSKHNLSNQVINDSKQYANELVEALIEWSKTDNRIGLEGLNYTPPNRDNNPQYWNGATLGQSFMMPFWWTSRPFVISTYRICEPPAPYTYSTDPNSAYYKDVKEVYDASFDPNKVFIGRYWANNPSVSGTPAGSWLGIANQLVDQYTLDLATTLKMYVLLTISTRDGFIACWYMKYKYNLERPVSYIRDVMGHQDWNSAVPTPPYPDYTSGTSTNGGTSSEILTRLFGVRAFVDNQHTDKGYGVRSFSSFKQAGIEAFHSRIYGGVHMRRACEMGFAHGECMASYVYENLHFEQ
jgi:hypothetical protein